MASSSMTTDRLRRALAAAALGLVLGQAAMTSGMAADATFTIDVVRREGDPAYEPPPAYEGLQRGERKPLIAAVEAGVKEQRIALRARGLTLEARETVLGEDEDAIAAVRALAATAGHGAVVLDLPVADVAAVGKALAREPVVLLNVRHGHDRLRGADCSPALFHVAASDSMLSDGLAQFLRKRNWTRVLVLEGPEEDDRRLSEAFQRSAKKFGLKLADTRKFAPTNDPRRRAESSVLLLTSGVAYDVVFVADAAGDFARTVAYQTRDPRPVVGSAGLVPAAWSWAWERQGAPQLNLRFQKATGQRMSPEDFAAWASVKLVVDALARGGSTDMAALRSRLLSPELTVDLYKGSPSNFRPWDRQLRQPVLLAAGDTVVERAPLDGFLHETNTLDTLGFDRPESACKAPSP